MVVGDDDLFYNGLRGVCSDTSDTRTKIEIVVTLTHGPTQVIISEPFDVGVPELFPNILIFPHRYEALL